MVDNIVTGILVALIFIAAGFIFFQTQTKQNIERLEQKQMFFLHDNLEVDVDSFLLFTENDTHKDFATLISYAIYRRRDNFSVFDPLDPDKAINITKEINYTLTKMFGTGNFFLNITPEIYDIGISFILDGSDSLTAERDQLRADLVSIVTSALIGDRTILVSVYIISQDDSKCTDFATEVATLNSIGPEVQALCTVIHGDHDTGDAGEAGRCMYPTIYDEVDSFKSLYEIYPPYDFGGHNKTERAWFTFYEADWAAGTAYSIGKSDEGGMARVNLHFPMAGELSTGSAGDECYTGEDFVYSDERTLCNFCNITCIDNGVVDTDEENRSWNIVQKAINIAVDKNQVICPIFAWNANYYTPTADPAYDAAWDLWVSIYNSLYNPTPNIVEDADSSLCEAPGCACTGDRFHVGYHPECINEVKWQMQQMADDTDGIYSELATPADISTAVQNAVDTYKEPYKIVIGEYDGDREQLVYEKNIPMPVGTDFVKMYLHVYQ